MKSVILPLKGNQSRCIILTDQLIVKDSMIMEAILIFYLISIIIMPNNIIVYFTSKTWGYYSGESSSSFNISSNSFYSSL